MKKNLKILLFVLVLFFMVPPVINFWITTPSVLGFVSAEKQDVWISFYAALIGGALTLAGVAWTIQYTEKIRKEDLEKHEQVRKDEFEKRNLETKINLAAQYKPILTIAYDAEFPTNLDHYTYNRKNILNLTSDFSYPMQDKKRICISLDLLNIGRGEANNLEIVSSVICPYGSSWDTEIRNYEELYIENGLNLVLFKIMEEDEWVYFDNRYLDIPIKICITVNYDDLVGFHHRLTSQIDIHRFIHFRDEKGNIVENVLVLNPYDTTIHNVTQTEERINNLLKNEC